MSQMLGKALDVVWAGERDDSDPSLQPLDLRVELPQLREMLQAEQSTEVAEQNQDRWPPQEIAARKGMTLDRLKIEIEVDPHRHIMRATAPSAPVGREPHRGPRPSGLYCVMGQRKSCAGWRVTVTCPLAAAADTSDPDFRRYGVTPAVNVTVKTSQSPPW